MSKSFLIDTTLCTACRGCQVACKQWNDLPGEKTVNMGSFENPQNLSENTYKIVRMREKEIEGKIKWLFFPEQCRHCIEAPCLETAEDETAIYRDKKTGAIVFTEKTKDLDHDSIIEACPYNIPRSAKDGTLTKCTMCYDRVVNGMEPACVKTCNTGAMQFGDRAEILEKARKRLAEVKKVYKNASLINENDLNVIYLVEENPYFYLDTAIASYEYKGITRQMALRKMVRPLSKLFKTIERMG